jgi:hydroxymethylpyrimidine pyrophosphatase-like HAD family hydrolase
VLPTLFAFDVDGTLVDSRGEFHARTGEALARLREWGSTIVIATGRPWRVVQRTVEMVGGADWAICSNGSKLVEVATGQVHRNVFLPADAPRFIVETIREHVPGVRFGVEFEDGAKSEDGWARRLPPGVPIGTPVEDILGLLDGELGPARGVIMFHDDFDGAPDRLAATVRDRVGHLGVEVRATGLPFVNVSVAGEHKARSLDTLAALLAIDRADTVAFGDEENDVEMIQWAGLGVAMGNAVPAVKAVADHVAPTNDDDGVAVTIDQILDGHLTWR